MLVKNLSQATATATPTPNYTLIMVGVLGLVFAPTLVVWLVTMLGGH